LLSKPHEYWRWADHTTTYLEFKKEMWVEDVVIFVTDMEKAIEKLV